MPNKNSMQSAMYHRILICVGVILISCSPLALAIKEDGQVVSFSIPAEPLADALLKFSAETGFAVFSSSDLLGAKHSAAIEGTYDPLTALELILRDSGLGYELISESAILVTKNDEKSLTTNPEPANADFPVEELIVSGIRWSLKSALEEKQEAGFISDVISSESLGKFPDMNIVESLQRMTGVAITRTRAGEGQFITVRGLGQQFNRVALNGHELATDNIGREFSFDILPAELISNVKVVKSVQADQDEGAIGANVLMETPRPLESPLLQAEFSVGKGFDELSGHTGDRVSGVFSNNYQDGNLGVLIAASYARRIWRSDMAQSLGFGFTQLSDKIDTNNDGVYEAGLQRPFFTAYPIKWGERERIGVVGTLEYNWDDSIHSTLSFFWGSYKTPEDATYQTNNFLRDFKSGSVTVDENNTITHFIIDAYDAEVVADPKRRIVDTNQIVWSADWQVSEQLTLHSDIGYSEARRPEGGKTKFWVAKIPGASVEYTARVPVPEVKVTLADGRDISEVTNEDIFPGYMETKGDDISDQNTSLHLDADWQLDRGNLASLSAGLYGQRQSKERMAYVNQAKDAYQNAKFNFADVGIVGLRPLEFKNFLNDIDGEFPRSWPHLDVEAIYRILQAADENMLSEFNTLYPRGYSDAVLPVFNPRGSSIIEEDRYAFYAQLNFEGDHWSGNLGSRIAITDVESSGFPQELLSIEPVAGTSDYKITTGPPAFMTLQRSYVNFLPSANIRFDLTENLVTRFAAAKTMARPSLAQLGIDVQYEANRGEFRLSRTGNPNLDPATANQFDITTEYYISDASFASVALFYKNISGFVSNGLSKETLLGREFTVTQPVNNRKAEVVGAELAYQHMWNNGFGFQINSSVTDSFSDVDDEYPALTSSLENLSQVSYNLIGIYEKGKWSARLALNQRGEYVQALVGQGFRPEVVDEYRQLDFNASYSVTDNLAVFIEGVNMLNEPRFVYAEFKNRFVECEETAARYYVGIRLTM